MQPVVSLCMIVRNEEAHLSDCLKGFADLVDEIILVDTGSTDRSKSIAAKFGAKVFDFPWCDDFAAARNESRRHATGRWIFWVDADDRIDESNRQKLRDVFASLPASPTPQPHVYLMSVLLRYHDSPANHPMGQARLFPAGAGLGWRGMVHEHIVDRNGKDDCFDIRPTEVAIQHIGYDDAEVCQRKLFRELRLLEKACLLYPDDPGFSYYLGDAHRRLGNPVLALQFLLRSIRNDPAGEMLSTRIAYCSAADCLKLTGRTREAIAVCREGLAKFPGNTSLAFYLAELLTVSQELAEAEQIARSLLAAPPNSLSLTGNMVDDFGLNLLLGDILSQQGRWGECEAYYRRAAGLNPRSDRALLALSQVGVSQQRQDLIRECIDRLADFPEATVARGLIVAQLAILNKQWREARATISEILAQAPNLPGAHQLLSDVCFQSNADLAESIQVHQKALSLDPAHVEIKRRLQILEARAAQSASAAANPRHGGLRVTVGSADHSRILSIA